MNTLLLHIGTPKTGTTATQSILQGLKKPLLKEGFFYPSMTSSINEHTFVSYSALKVPIIKIPNGKNLDNTVGFSNNQASISFADEYFGKVVEFGEKIRIKNYIFSSESIWGNCAKDDYQYIKKYLQNYFDRVIIYITLRPRAEFLQSLFHEKSKTFSKVEGFEKFYEGYLDRGSVYSHSIDYWGKIVMLEEIFSPENVIVKEYYNNLQVMTESMLSSFGPRVSFEKFPRSKFRPRESPPPHYTLFMNKIIHTDPHLWESINKNPHEAIKSISQIIGTDKKQFTFISQGIIDELHQYFYKDNQILKHQYAINCEYNFHLNSNDYLKNKIFIDKITESEFQKILIKVKQNFT